MAAGAHWWHLSCWWQRPVTDGGVPSSSTLTRWSLRYKPAAVSGSTTSFDPHTPAEFGPSPPASVNFLNAPEADLDSAFVSHHLLPGWSPCAQAGPFQNTLQGPQGNPLESSTVINPLCVEPPDLSTLEGSSCRVFLISPQIPSSLPRFPSIITIVNSANFKT